MGKEEKDGEGFFFYHSLICEKLFFTRKMRYHAINHASSSEQERTSKIISDNTAILQMGRLRPKKKGSAAPDHTESAKKARCGVQTASCLPEQGPEDRRGMLAYPKKCIASGPPRSIPMMKS